MLGKSQGGARKNSGGAYQEISEENVDFKKISLKDLRRRGSNQLDGHESVSFGRGVWGLLELRSKTILRTKGSWKDESMGGLMGVKKNWAFLRNEGSRGRGTRKRQKN